jgi:opacity protein-like surface antigen
VDRTFCALADVHPPLAPARPMQTAAAERRNLMRKLFIAISALTLAAGAAFAEENDELVIPSGMSLSVGGGVGGFTEETMRELTDVGGGWNARFVVGTRTVIGFEAAYIGGLQTIDTLGLDADALLLSSSIEGDVRFAPTRLVVESPIHPYVFWGLAYRRYDVTNTDTNTSSVEDEDSLVEMPLGLGATYAIDRFQIDLRASYRPAWDADLVPDAKEGTGLATWGASLQVGYEF